MPHAPVLLCGAAAGCLVLVSNASAQELIADFEWDVTLALVTTGSPPPPIDIPFIDFRITSRKSNVGGQESVILGAGELVLASGGSGSVDLDATTDPVAFDYFADGLTGQSDNDQAWLAFGIGPSFEQYFSDNSSLIILDEFSPTELDDLYLADIGFFRIIVGEVLIENGVGGEETRADVTTSGRFEIWTPAPGAAALLAFGAFPLGIRRRR